MKGLPAWVFLTRTWLASFFFLGRKRGVRLIHEGALYNVNYGSESLSNMQLKIEYEFLKLSSVEHKLATM